MHNEEYSFLREEIIKDSNMVQSYRNIMFTTNAAILTFAFTQSEPLIFLIPLTVIMPLFQLCMGRAKAMCRIGAYLIVFLEGKEFHWERRLHKYDDVYASTIKKSSVSTYAISVIICMILCLYKIDYMHFKSTENIVRFAVCFISSIICFVIIHKKQVDYIKVKNDYIKKWEYIKKDYPNL